MMIVLPSASSAPAKLHLFLPLIQLTATQETPSLIPLNLKGFLPTADMTFGLCLSLCKVSLLPRPQSSAKDISKVSMTRVGSRCRELVRTEE